MTAPAASHFQVADPPGEPTTLALYGPAGALAAIVLGPAECIALASDLLASARVRMGRPPVPVTVERPPEPPEAPPRIHDVLWSLA